MDKTSRIMPKWMQIDNKGIKLEDPMYSKDYVSIRNKKKKFTLLIDKANNNSVKSVFSVGDFRHNVLSKEDADLFSSKVANVPKQFNSWREKEEFHPKFRRDVEKEVIENFSIKKKDAEKKLEKKYQKNNKFKL